MLSVRTSFQTISGCRGFPVVLCHTRVLSLWLVMPTAVRPTGSTRALSTAALTQSATFSCEGSRTAASGGARWQKLSAARVHETSAVLSTAQVSCGLPEKSLPSSRIGERPPRREKPETKASRNHMAGGLPGTHANIQQYGRHSLQDEPSPDVDRVCL